MTLFSLIQLLVIALAPSLAVMATAFVMRGNRKADTQEKEAGVQDTYFKQAVELASQYREELGRQKQIIDSLEKKLAIETADCDRKIMLLQRQINGLISQLSSRGIQPIEVVSD